MDNFAPGLKDIVISLSETLRVVVYFVCVLGLILQVQAARVEMEGIVKPVFKAVVVVAMVATLPHWFGFTERILLSIADTVQEGYVEHPMRAATKVREMVGASGTEFSLRRVGESVYQAFLQGSMKAVVLVGSFIQVPVLILQYVLKLLCYLFLPVALGMFMIPSQANLASRYVQQSVAILAWPVGFAVTELVAYHLVTGYANNLAVAYGLTPGEIDAASFGSLMGGVLGALWLVVGTVGTPFLMQKLIASGSPMGTGVGAAMQQISTLQQIAWTLKTMKTAGAGAPALAASVAGRVGGSGGGAGGSMSAPPPPSPPAPSTPVSSAGDPAGDARARGALAMTQLPTPQTSI